MDSVLAKWFVRLVVKPVIPLVKKWIRNQWIIWAMMAASLLFVSLFVVSEFDGFVVLGEYLLDAIKLLPSSIQTIADYYREIPSSQVVPSLLIGAIWGMIITLIVVLFGRIDLHNLSNEFADKRVQRLLIIGVALGAIGGVVGSQIIIYPLRHCTYTPNINASEYLLGILATIAGTFFILLPIWSLLRRNSKMSRSGNFNGTVQPLLFLFPTLISLSIFLYYPATQIVTLSLKLKRNPLPQERFVCLQNYVNLADDPTYINSFAVTFLITAAIVIIGMSLALMIALLASQNIRGINIYRTLLIWPYALSPVVAGAIFNVMFQQESGVINYVLAELFTISPKWLTDVSFAPWVVIAASVWNILGFNILFYIAGLQSIPKDLLEAAEIDGASRITRFLRIMFPLLSPFTFFLLVTNVTYSFYGIYGAVDTLTGGGPPLGPGGRDGGATSVLIYKLYEDAFGAGSSTGSAAAQSLILFLMVAGFTLVQFRILERRVVYAD